MAYAVRFLRLVVAGTVYGSETFSWSMSFMRNFAPAAVPPSAVPGGFVTALTTFWSSPYWSNAAEINTIKLNEIGTNGRYVDQGNTVAEYLTTPIPGTGTIKPAPQVALAITLRTAKSRGRAHAGRFYVPTPAILPSADGLLSAPSVLEIAGMAKDMLDDFQTALGADWMPAVMSNVGTGTQEPITHVAVGRVLDTVRSRRTSLGEDYQESAPLGT